jgi:hypothetical protein
MLHVWADGTWCWANETRSDMSDDYLTISVPEWCDNDDAELISRRVQEVGCVDDDWLAGLFGL